MTMQRKHYTPEEKVVTPRRRFPDKIPRWSLEE